MIDERDEVEFFRCEECKKLHHITKAKEIKVKNVMYPLFLCEDCYKKIGGKNDSKPIIRTDEGSKGTSGQI